MDISSIKPSEIIFKDKIFSSRFSEVFIVQVCDETIIMKVHHDNGPVVPAPRDRETNIHICELTAYKRLKDHGLCDQGIVPRFYGTIERLDLSCYQPHLKAFLGDKCPPNAIFLEYIPNMEMILPENYTKKRGEAFVRGIQAIHKAFILHLDVKPRNMMILKDDPERVIWLDFDRAQTYHPSTITERQKGFIENEGVIVSQFVEALEIDQARVLEQAR